MESISQVILIVFGIVVFTRVRDGNAADWFKAKFFNSAEPSPLGSSIAGAASDAGTGIAGTAGDAVSGALDRLVVGAGGFIAPLVGAVTSGFGPRTRPCATCSANHQGLDIDGETGDPVRASRAGQVTFAGNAGGYGFKVDIDHGGGIVTRYAHLSRMHVQVGQQVAAGAVIGEVGATGNATGAHLHFEILRNGEKIDPSGVLSGAPG